MAGESGTRFRMRGGRVVHILGADQVSLCGEIPWRWRSDEPPHDRPLCKTCERKEKPAPTPCAPPNEGETK